MAAHAWLRTIVVSVTAFGCSSNPGSGMMLGNATSGGAPGTAGANAGGAVSVATGTTGSMTAGNGATSTGMPSGASGAGGTAGTGNSTPGGVGGMSPQTSGGATSTSGSGTAGVPGVGGTSLNAGGGSGDPGGATSGGTAAGGEGAGGLSSGGQGTGGADATGSVFPPSVTTPKIMIVGDSISAGPGCYKKYLKQNLTDNGVTNYEFVGEYADDCGGDVRHSAVSCTTSGQFAEATFTVPNCTSTTYPGLATLMESHNPDLLMIQLGVNDVWGGSAPIEPILANYETLVTQARAHNPNIVVVVAQIHKIITDNCSNAASTTNAQELIEAVPGWAETVTTADSPVLTADLWTNSDAHEADDCVHPNDAGAERMGGNWYEALKDILE